MNKQYLEVGDIIYKKPHLSKTFKHKYVIDRVTKTQAITKNKQKFKREIDNYGNVQPIKSEGISFDSSIYRLENENIKDEYIRYNIINIIYKSDLNKLSTEDLRKIYNIIKY